METATIACVMANGPVAHAQMSRVSRTTNHRLVITAV
eukprot:COSAG04_NODE_28989_length_272_cov_0.595376_1_plen_36_part_01